MERKTFVFYKKWANAISWLPPEIRLEIYEGIIGYATTGKFPDLKMAAQVGFSFVKEEIDEDLVKYQQSVEKNRENGKKGGRPKNPKNSVGFEETQPNPKNLDNDNEYDNDISFLEKKKQKTYTPDEGEFSGSSQGEDFSGQESSETDLETEETLSKSSAKKFSLIWDTFKGKKNSFEKDYSKFLKKTEGLEIDFEKLQEEAYKAKDIRFQSWLNQIFPKSSKQEETFDFHKALLNTGFDAELSAEWLKIRKAKKAVNSELAFKNFMREVEKSGRSPDEVLAIVVQKQWKGFEASWLHNEQFTNGQRTMSNEQRAINNNAEPKFGRTPASEVARSLTGWGD